MLASCATPSSRPIEPIVPRHVDPALCAAAAAEPKIPDNAGFPRPTTDADRDSAAAFLGWISDLALWGRGLKDRADRTAASNVCH